MHSSSKTKTLYYTELRDADMAELIELFVQELPKRVDAIQHAVTDGRWSEVRSLAHQIKGASGSYGFPQLMRSAASLELAVREGATKAEIRAALEQLATICSLTRPGSPIAAAGHS